MFVPNTPSFSDHIWSRLEPFSETFNIRWCWSIWKSPITAHPTKSNNDIWKWNLQLNSTSDLGLNQFDFKLWFHLFKIFFKIFKTLGDNSWSFIIFGVKLKLVNELNFAWANLASNQRQYLSYMCLVYRLEHGNNRNANITNFVYFEKKHYCNGNSKVYSLIQPRRVSR